MLQRPHNNNSSCTDQQVDPSCLIVHFDASMKEGIGMGVDLIIRNHYGEFMAATTMLLNAFDPSLVEAAVLSWSLGLLKELGITHAHLFSDCLLLSLYKLEKEEAK
ncbi:hypothetical protein RIF29_06544 [Crotalaria pallida]|uniref:RNase H type-1 domain-containing protein n=1 Tax=Crotalaria pallida TaxID=3830 RepID=A0AAN9J4F1_CROPI